MDVNFAYNLAAAVGLVGYIGPGPGITITGALIGLIVTIFVALLAVLRWPIRLLWRKLRGEGDEDDPDEEGDADERAPQDAGEEEERSDA
jgi:hypothetical protein